MSPGDDQAQISLRSDGLVTQADYVALALFRQTVRLMCQDSETVARRRGLTPQQHQALLAIKAAEGEQPPSIGSLAERLCIRPHSTVELVDRLVQLRLVERRIDDHDHRRVRVSLTQRAQSLLDGLAEAHLRELREMRPALEALLARVDLRRPEAREPVVGNLRPPLIDGAE